MTPQELELLDAATRHAQTEIDAMLKTADRMLASHQAFLRDMRKLRRDDPR
ncbi:hypothetical protein D3C83_72220 [compost metagenome]